MAMWIDQHMAFVYISNSSEVSASLDGLGLIAVKSLTTHKSYFLFILEFLKM